MMKYGQNYLLVGIAALFVSGTGCVAVEFEDSLDVISQADDVENGLPNNGLPNNGLPNNGLPNNGLASTAIESEWDAWLNDPTDIGGMTLGARNNILMKYIVRCALPGGTSSSFKDSGGTLHTWYGEIGVAPNWSTGALTSTEQRWVSSCVTSLVNADATSVIVSQRGENDSPYVMMPDEATNYPVTEGAYFGNMFADPPVYYACNNGAYTTERLPGRRCTLAAGNCSPITLTSSCQSICQSEPRTVDSVPFTVYHDCTVDSVTYPEVTTIFVP